ncbi:hypothetical protein DMENIID0001_078940 [Sergentomyia squamirostris]
MIVRASNFHPRKHHYTQHNGQQRETCPEYFIRLTFIHYQCLFTPKSYDEGFFANRGSERNDAGARALRATHTRTHFEFRQQLLGTNTEDEDLGRVG